MLEWGEGGELEWSEGVERAGGKISEELKASESGRTSVSLKRGHASPLELVVVNPAPRKLISDSLAHHSKLK